MHRRFTRIVLVMVATAAVLTLGGGAAPAAEAVTPDAVEKAQTRAQHTAIADTYAAQAADHKAMLASYDKGPGYLKEKSGLVQHCKSLINYYEQAAAEAEQMAKSHRNMAAAAGK